jgi:hypothetical protein
MMAAMMSYGQNMAKYCPYYQECHRDKNCLPALTAAAGLTIVCLFVFTHFWFSLTFSICYSA